MHIETPEGLLYSGMRVEIKLRIGWVYIQERGI